MQAALRRTGRHKKNGGTQQMDRKYPGFSIEATSFCRDGHWPRWSWWIRGIGNSARYGVVGTDEDGRGLYLYSFAADRSSRREPLLPPDAFALADGVARRHANDIVVEALVGLGWGRPA